MGAALATEYAQLEFAAMAAVSRHATRQPDPRATQAAGITKKVWLLMYSEGGRWAAEEIAQRLQVARPLCTSALVEMASTNFVIRYRTRNIDDEFEVRFAVTSKCKVPRGVVVAEIQELLEMAAGARV